MVLPPKASPPPRGKGPDWGSIIAYGLIALMAALALTPLFSALT
ncbi:hypothetical protein [Sediminicoccus sp. KRV36]|nr:hypothetical protein [Sediminicoccus rosea]